MGQPEAMKALLDTHVLLWWHGDRGRLSREQRDVIAAAGADLPLEVSDISLWEVAMLYSLGRIRLTIPLREWLDKAVAAPLVRRHVPTVCGEAGGGGPCGYPGGALIAGPRRAGKTTLARKMAEEGRTCVTLDDRTVLDAALSDPNGFIRGLDPSSTRSSAPRTCCWQSRGTWTKTVASLVPTPHPNLPRQSTQNQKTTTRKIAPAGFSASC